MCINNATNSPRVLQVIDHFKARKFLVKKTHKTKSPHVNHRRQTLSVKSKDVHFGGIYLNFKPFEGSRLSLNNEDQGLAAPSSLFFIYSLSKTLAVTFSWLLTVLALGDTIPVASSFVPVVMCSTTLVITLSASVLQPSFIVAVTAFPAAISTFCLPNFLLTGVTSLRWPLY
ncbi:unnamed protein product [Cuscuta europaea]|uniref:Uncharacterized protein n=1 Tax=Cuscuta europaea TaxID=41803 RepID=A0A9P1E098_CUSEU|nr:unnamed protein product [Cuscuta europaea]